jgi:Tol biopolymer transport system component
MVVYSARDEMGQTRLHLRRLDSPDATVLSGTDGAAYPFWSPDGRYIGFTGDGKLKKVAVGGGPPVTLCAAENLKGGTWNREGVVLFAPTHNSAIFRVSAAGGEAVAATTLPDSGNVNSHRHPRFLPDGKHFLFLARLSGGDENEVMLGSLDGAEPRRITSSQAAAEYSMGHLLTVREGILLATPFEPSSGELGEGGVPLVEDILIVSQGAACGQYSPGGDGMLVYQVSTGSTDRGLEWIGAAGSGGDVGEPGSLFRPRISPDGTQAVVEILDEDHDSNDLWLVDLSNGLRTRFTFDPIDEYEAIWSRDGSEIFFTRTDSKEFFLMRQPVEGTAGAEVVLRDSLEMVATDVTPDGRSLMLERDAKDTGYDVWEFPLDGSEPRLLVQTPQTDGGSLVSPDGRWFVYHEEVTGTWEVNVRPMEGGPRKFQVGKDAVFPFWSPTGDAIYYVDFAGELQKVAVDGSGNTFRVGPPTPVGRIASPAPGGRYVDVHPDGERFLHVGGEVSDDETGYLQIVTDWRRGLAN